jgi:hypothetical protein
MSEANLLCSRPHSRTVDFNTSRFIVANWRGLNVDGVHLEMGAEIPSGVLPPDALQREYEAPPRNIELLEFALTIPAYREACARQGVDIEAALKPPPPPPAPKVEPPPPAPKPKKPALDLEKLTKDQLLDLCSKYKLSAHGTFKQIRERIAAHLEQ